VSASSSPRTFKTAWFAKAARKALIADDELCRAIEQVRRGQADDLGGGVFKKRLDANRHRSIIVAKGGRYWVYTYLFAKKDRSNITPAELAAFRDLADLYDRKNDAAIGAELASKALTEICNAG
jgi:hypothetical protein